MSKKVIIKTIYEPLNYDHPTFYFFLGIFLGFISIGAINFLVNLSVEYIKLISYTISFLSITMGIYFIINKPIYKRDEKEKQITDYIWGGIFIIGSLLILLSTI